MFDVTVAFVPAGSKDGCVRLWECSRDFRHLTPLFTVPVVCANTTSSLEQLVDI